MLTSLLLQQYNIKDAHPLTLSYPSSDVNTVGQPKKVAMARIVSIKNRSLLLVAEWNNFHRKPPMATVVAYVDNGGGAYVSTDIKFENVVLFWEAGVAISRCGTLAAFCQKHDARDRRDCETYLTVLNLATEDGRLNVLHSLLHELLPGQQATSLDFSPCSSFLLLGFSYTQEPGLDSTQYPVAHVYRTVDCQRLLVHLSVNQEDNCSNGARFLVGSKSPSFVYGTVGGRVVLVGDPTNEEELELEAAAATTVQYHEPHVLP